MAQNWWYLYKNAIMKKRMCLAAFCCMILFFSCSKEKFSNEVIIRYDFSATLDGNYQFVIVADTIQQSETNFTSDWSKTITVNKSSNSSGNTEFAVFPPADWAGTDNAATVNLKIFVNNTVRASESGQLTGAGRPQGVRVSTTY